VYCILERVQEGIPFEEFVPRYYSDIAFVDVEACVQYATALVKIDEVCLAAP